MNLKFVSAAVLLASVLLSGCSKGTAVPAQSTESSAVAVNIFRVKEEKIARTVELVGTLQGEQEVTVSSEIAARVTAIRADLGDRVTKGQPLVELDTTEYRMAVDRQRSALLQVLAQLGVAGEKDPIPAAIQTSMVRKAQADLTDAKASFERTQTLVSKGVAAKALLDTAEARYLASQANYTTALEQVHNFSAQADNLRTQLALAEKKLGDCIIRAPFGGTIRSRMVEVGQYIKDQTAVISLASVNPLKLEATVPERWFPNVTKGIKLTLSVEAYPAEQFQGTVTRVAGSVDPQNRTFAIEAHIDNSNMRLRPGLFARATITTSKVEQVMRVPAAAVISFYGVQKVYGVENGKITERVVKLGDRTGDMIEVTEGITPGLSIATSELSRIRNGVLVQVRSES